MDVFSLNEGHMGNLNMMKRDIYIYIFTAMNHIDCHSCMSVIVYVYKMPNISYKKSKELLSTSSFSKIVTRKAHHYAIEQSQHSVCVSLHSPRYLNWVSCVFFYFADLFHDEDYRLK